MHTSVHGCPTARIDLLANEGTDGAQTALQALTIQDLARLTGASSGCRSRGVDHCRLSESPSPNPFQSFGMGRDTDVEPFDRCPSYLHDSC